MNWSDYFLYESYTGYLVWKNRPLYHFKNLHGFRIWNSQNAGTVAGARSSVPSGRRMKITVSIDQRLHLAHRIIWEMHYGPIPDGMVIDHINGDPWDNRLSNLRVATVQQNTINRKKAKNNTSGYVGVSQHKRSKRWRSNIVLNKKTISLGTFDTKEQAFAAYRAAAMENFGDFVHQHISNGYS